MCIWKSRSSGWYMTRFRTEGICVAERVRSFSVSGSSASRVVTYIAQQAEHHKHVTFMEEFAAFLKLHGIQQDPRDRERIVCPGASTDGRAIDHTLHGIALQSLCGALILQGVFSTGLSRLRRACAVAKTIRPFGAPLICGTDYSTFAGFTRLLRCKPWATLNRPPSTISQVSVTQSPYFQCSTSSFPNLSISISLVAFPPRSVHM